MASLVTSIRDSFITAIEAITPDTDASDTFDAATDDYGLPDAGSGEYHRRFEVTSGNLQATGQWGTSVMTMVRTFEVVIGYELHRMTPDTAQDVFAEDERAIIAKIETYTGWPSGTELVTFQGRSLSEDVEGNPALTLLFDVMYEENL